MGALAADAQTYPAYFANVAALTGNMTPAPTLPTVVTLGGYYNTVGDGGGGTFAVGPGPCTANGGTIFVDMATPAQCYTRVTPSNNVREWGAKCDVVAIQPTAALTATWQPTLHDPNLATGHTNYYGALQVTPSLLNSLPMPTPGQAIAISQVGTPTLWGGTAAAPAKPAIWATVFDTVRRRNQLCAR